jgi:hypothetical protein
MSYSSLYRLESGMVKNPPLWWYNNCAIALGVKLEEILDYTHSGWHGSDEAPKSPGADWLKAPTRKQKQTAPSTAPSAAAPRLLRKSSLAASD